MKIRKNDDLLGLANIEVIGSSGERLGVMTPAEGLRLAREQGLDLVEVNPRSQPPVSKILDPTKFSYEEAGKAALSRRGPAPTVTRGARRPSRPSPRGGTAFQADSRSAETRDVRKT
jgi:translation initiation factor IF-3